ncbi:Putative virion core protein (lumpy skin disease virus) (plasmid) [Tsukamurella tyrosinosolvens]|uniref:Membrane protease subunit, stomatin/prohibitin family, contains C-terminal Zn-ribbon domain n=2 Tax=Tsukamurella tyrosinosolvens TaxID=57704 RepID=A0A1H4WDV4_TSUTY|nr:SPFH domain-containing protein [Tsukamurella tyrosinosolvens]KXO99359.1 antifreeze protein [Tsukamurella tyrosinosolvens]RDB47112.1 SPFH domain-containing protein [Tsukamurella tyrosinosolvens]SEC91447.1 Membrane protease subunit, stomatin/prohibitin family, contains C-terminal Zn-ribbon domain [Tsukamurella tyrosinosolvens]VEH89277.1 Putative virion core protein (lumpy skin disease virus) [Tsukamurella tyrosinosolvens]
MGIMDRVRGELVDIIEWLEDNRSTMAWRFPRYNNEIKNGAQLIVREGQEALFVYRGQLADRYGPGNYQLVSENMPVMSTLQGWPHGFKSPFRSEVYFVNTRPITDLRWGTANPITIRDQDFGMVQVRANGLCVVRVVDSPTFLRQVIGTDSNVDSDEIAELLRRTITTAFSEMLIETGVGAIDLQARQRELAAKLQEYVQSKVNQQYGLACEAIELNISLPDEITQAMTRGVARGVEEKGYYGNVGDMNRFQQGRAADAMLGAATNEGGGGAGDFLGAGMGMAMGQQFAQNFQNQQAPAQGAQPGPGAQQPGPPPLPTAQAFHVEQNGQSAGPFPVEQLRTMNLTPQTLVWSPALTDWTPAGQVPALAPLFGQTPPPLPPRS